jgi:hypothetical protein
MGIKSISVLSGLELCTQVKNLRQIKNLKHKAGHKQITGKFILRNNFQAYQIWLAENYLIIIILQSR